MLGLRLEKHMGGAEHLMLGAVLHLGRHALSPGDGDPSRSAGRGAPAPHLRPMMRPHFNAGLVGLALLAACGSSETTAPSANDTTPSYSFAVSGEQKVAATG